MERLTRLCTIKKDGEYKYNPHTVGEFIGIYPNTTLGNVVERLAYYEDLEEQGFILKAPCRIDDTVYVKTRYSIAQPYEIVECRVSKIAALSSGKGASITCVGRYKNGNPYNGNFRISSFGKKVFTSKEEAEKSIMF